jgi:hypothetical protein
MEPFSELQKNRLEAYVGSLLTYGLAKTDGPRLALTPSGMFRSNAIISDIVKVTGEVKNRHS